MLIWYSDATFDPYQPPPGAAPMSPRGAVGVRPAGVEDLEQVIAIDAEITGLAKTDYWYELFHRYGGGRSRQRLFLVAEAEGAIQGFIIGEVRDWEFGSPPCGWVFAISVRPAARVAGVGTRLLEAICAGFRHAGVDKLRTLIARDNGLVLSFFRSQGMMAAPVIPLEKDLQ
jgi:ribosomal protein S18 acetylase RimI-like enzyme